MFLLAGILKTIGSSSELDCILMAGVYASRLLAFPSSSASPSYGRRFTTAGTNCRKSCGRRVFEQDNFTTHVIQHSPVERRIRSYLVPHDPAARLPRPAPASFRVGRQPGVGQQCRDRRRRDARQLGLAFRPVAHTVRSVRRDACAARVRYLVSIPRTGTMLTESRRFSRFGQRF